MGGQWPLVGRTGELRRLEGVRPGVARGILLAGEAGVGKTRLALEYLHQAEKGGAAVARVCGSRAGSALPLGAFAPLLPPLHDGESGGGVDDRADLLRRCATFLRESAAGRPLMLFADDAHLLDPVSAMLVHQMAVTGAAFVVATIRSGEPVHDPIVSLWKDDTVERVEVAGLQADSVEELLLSVLGGPVDRGTIHRLVIGSQGNVLFLRELVLGALSDGSLRNDVGIWRLAGPLSPSPRLGELVETRLAGLRPEERSLLEVLSIGEPLGMAEVSRLGAAVLAEKLERQGLVASETDGRRLRVRLGHSLYADVIRVRMPALRAREVARQLAEAVEAAGARRREDLVRVATWRLEGGSGQPEMMLQAAVQARWRCDFPLAARLAAAAVQAGAGFDASFLAAQLASLQGQNEEAETMLARLAEQAADDRQRGLVACARLDNLAFHMGRVDTAVNIADQAEATITDRAWRDEIAAKRGSVLGELYGPRAGSAAAEPLLERTSGRAFVWASLLTSYSTGRQGQLERARRIADRGYEAHLALTEPIDWHPWTHLFFRADALAHAGQIDDAYALATEQYQQSLLDESPEAQGWFAWQLAKTAADRGFPRTAAVHGRTAVAVFHQLGRPLFESFAFGTLAMAEALSGDPEAAAAALGRLDALRLPQTQYYVVDLLVARAWVMVSAGNLPSAIQVLKEATVLGAEIGDLVGEAVAWHDLARLGHPGEALDGLSALSSQIDGKMVPTRVDHALALATGHEVGLADVSARFEEMGAILLAAEAAADEAVAWRRSGDARRAANAEQRANVLAIRCENPVTPALQAVRNRSRLTQSERETALLAASGKPNKKIAQVLGISVRTVENHLQHVYTKLGISGRGELSETLENAY